jgi:hypothetical protein
MFRQYQTVSKSQRTRNCDECIVVIEKKSSFTFSIRCWVIKRHRRITAITDIRGNKQINGRLSLTADCRTRDLREADFDKDLTFSLSAGEDMPKG